MSDQGRLSFIQAQDGTLVIRLVGAWSLRAGIPSSADVQGQVASTGISRGVAFDARELTSWDSSVLTFLVEVSELCRQRGINMDRAGLPAGVRRLLDLAEAVPEKKGARKEEVGNIVSRTRRQQRPRRRLVSGRRCSIFSAR